MVSEGQQIRAVHQLAGTPPLLILLRDNNMTFDGLPLAIRSPILWSWLLNNWGKYRVFESPDSLWMVGSEIVGEFEARVTGYEEIVHEAQLGAADSALSKLELSHLPHSWGRGIANDFLRDSTVQQFSLAGPTEFSNINVYGEIYELAGADPWVRFNFSPGSLIENELHLLDFTVKCLTRSVGFLPLKIYWATPDQPESEFRTFSLMARCDERNLLPLYASARFSLEASQVQSVRFDWEGEPRGSYQFDYAPKIITLRIGDG